jgi:hypothetical protein
MTGDHRRRRSSRSRSRSRSRRLVSLAAASRRAPPPRPPRPQAQPGEERRRRRTSGTLVRPGSAAAARTWGGKRAVSARKSPEQYTGARAQMWLWARACDTRLGRAPGGLLAKRSRTGEEQLTRPRVCMPATRTRPRTCAPAPGRRRRRGGRPVRRRPGPEPQPRGPAAAPRPPGPGQLGADRLVSGDRVVS